MTLRLALAGLLAVVLCGGPVSTPAIGDPHDARAQSAYMVRATVEKHRVVEDSGFVHVKGRVSPNAVGEQVILQQRRVGKSVWRATDTTRITEGGRFRLLDLPGTPGVRHYRVVKPASGGLGAGVSAPLRVVVLDYEWSSLTGSEVVKENLVTGPVDVIRTRHDGRLTLVNPGEPAFVEYDLGGRCAVLDVGAGMAATSAPGSRGWVLLSRDGAEDFDVYDSEYSDGGPSFAETPVTGTMRLRLEVSATQAPPGYPSLMRIRAFCAA